MVFLKLKSSSNIQNDGQYLVGGICTVPSTVLSILVRMWVPLSKESLFYPCSYRELRESAVYYLCTSKNKRRDFFNLSGTLIMTTVTYSSKFLYWLFFQSCWPTRDHIGRSTGISNPAWHLPQVVPRVVQTTGSVHPQPILANCQLCINTEPTTSIGRLIKSSQL